MHRRLPHNELGLLLPTYADAELVRLLGITPSDRVLDVGGGAVPFARADVIVEMHVHDNVHRGGMGVQGASGKLVQASVEALPFRDGAFDFVVCRHVLEHVDDPVAACRELSRVAKRGYIETPSRVNELMHGYPNHVWMVEPHGRGLRFEPKPFVRNPFRNVTRALHYANPEFRELFEGPYRNVFCTQVYWEDCLEATVVPRGEDDFDYGNPVHACVAHLDYALNYLAYGLDGHVSAEVEEHLRRAADIAGPGTVPAALLAAWQSRSQLSPGELQERVHRLRECDLVKLVAAEIDGAQAPAKSSLVVSGCGRSGTGYMAALLTELGLRCGHEAVFTPDRDLPPGNGPLTDSSWLAAPFLGGLPEGTAVLHQVRDPIDVIRSCMGIGLFAEPSPYRDFLQRHCPAIFDEPDELSQCMAYWVWWNELVESAADQGGGYLRYRLEDVDPALLERVAGHAGVRLSRAAVDAALRKVPRDVNTRARDNAVGWQSLPDGPLRSRLEELAARYGYRVPGRQAASAVPDATVVVRTFNRPDALRRCLASLLSQRLHSFEVVVVNDGGLEPSHVVAEFADRLDVRLVGHATNRGRSAALNTGVARARGRYVCLLDDDDLLYASHLETLVAEADRLGGQTVVYSHAFEALEDGRGGVRERRLQFDRDFDRDDLLVTNYLPILTVLVPRSAFDETGPFDESFDVLEDWDYWIRLAGRRPFVRLSAVTCEYRRPAAAASSTTREAPKHVAALERLYAKHPVEERLVARREAALARTRPLTDAYPYRYSVLVAARDDLASLLDCLQSIMRVFDGEPYEVVVHAPPAPDLQPLLSALEEDVVILVGEDTDPATAWGVARRHAAGRVRVLVTSDDVLDSDVLARCAQVEDGGELLAAAVRL